MKKRIIATTLILGLAGGAALAGPGGKYGHGVQMFDRLDLNGDGMVTRDEMNQSQAERFARFDANSDGKLNVDELDAGIRRERAERMFKWLDRDGDGAVTQAELGSLGEKMFDKMDANSDGAVSKDEIRTKRHVGKPERAERPTS